MVTVHTCKIRNTVTVRRAETRDTTAPVSCSNSLSFCCNRTSTHKPRTRDFSWEPDGLQSDIDTDRVMVDIDTSILITNTHLNDFQISIKRDSDTDTQNCGNLVYV